MRIEAPGFGEMVQISQRDGAYYWSACAHVVVAHALSNGRVLGNWPQGGQKNMCRIILRDTQWTDPLAETFTLAEGPIAPSVLNRCGLSTRTKRSSELSVVPEGGNGSFRLAFRRNLVREIPKKGSRDDPEPHSPASMVGLYDSPPIQYQVFTRWPDNYSPVLWEAENQGGSVVALVSKKDLLLGFPLFDVGAQNLTVDPLPHGYYSTQDGCRVDDLVRFLFETFPSSLADMLPISGAPRTTTDSECLNPFLTIRHDVDRPITNERLFFLLSEYAELRLKATWSIQNQVAPPKAQIDAILAEGHEINLHSCASSQTEFNAELEALKSLYGVSVSGFTSHGGKGAGGNLGVTTNLWALRANLEYGEITGGFRVSNVPLIRVESGVPSATSLVIPPAHFSFDRSLLEGDHYGESILDRISRRLRDGGHVIVMNHPDVHTDAFADTLRALPHGSFTPTTLVESARYQRSRSQLAITDQESLNEEIESRNN